MVITWADVLGALNSVAAHVTFTQMVIGGLLPLIKPWIVSEETIGNRVALAKEKLIFRLSQCHRRILDAQKKVLSSSLAAAEGDNPLEAISPGKVDVVQEHAAEIFRGALTYRRLEGCHAAVKRVYHYLLSTIFVGLVLFLLSIGVAATRPYAALLSALILLSQILCVFRIRAITHNVEEYENSL